MQLCLRPLFLLPGPGLEKEGREWMVLAAVLSLPVTTCPPSRALERAHPAHPRYHYNKFWFHCLENWKCSTWAHTAALAFAGRGTGQHRAHTAKKLSGQTFIHLGTEIQVALSAQQVLRPHWARQSTTAPPGVPDRASFILLHSAVRIWGLFAPWTSWQSLLMGRKRKPQASCYCWILPF